MNLSDKTPEELTWSDLGNHAYYHWQHMRSHLTDNFNILCKEATEKVFNALSQEQKDKLLKEKINYDLREKNHYGKMSQLLIDMGHKEIVEKIGSKPKDFTAPISSKLYPSWKLDLETGEYEPPIPNPRDGKKYNWNEVTQQWVETEKWGEQTTLSHDEKLSYNQKRKERLEICSICEYNKKNWCSECGCNISLKTAAPWMSCPINKWESMWSEDEKRKYHVN